MKRNAGDAVENKQICYLIYWFTHTHIRWILVKKLERRFSSEERALDNLVTHHTCLNLDALSSASPTKVLLLINHHSRRKALYIHIFFFFLSLLFFFLFLFFFFLVCNCFFSSLKGHASMHAIKTINLIINYKTLICVCDSMQFSKADLCMDQSKRW